MVQDSWLSDPGVNTVWCHCIDFLGWTLNMYFHSGSLHPGVEMGWGNPSSGE